MAKFHPKLMINGATLILKQLIFHFLMKMFLAPFPMLYTFRRLIRFARVCSHADDLDTINLKELLESLILVIN